MDMTDFVPTKSFGQVARSAGMPEDGERLLFVFNFGLNDDLLATVKTVRRNPVAQMRFSRRRVNRQRR